MSGPGAIALERARELQPAVVVLDLAIPRVARVVHALRQVCPQARMVGIGPLEPAAAVRRAVRAGLDDVLSAVDAPAALGAAVTRVLAPASARPLTPGEIFTVTSAADGGGATMVAAALARALQAQARERVLVVDLASFRRGIAPVLGVEPRAWLTVCGTKTRSREDLGV